MLSKRTSSTLIALTLTLAPALAQPSPTPSPTPAAAQAQVAADPSAYLLDLDGPAYAHGPAGDFRPHSAMPLWPGTLIKLPAGSKLQLTFTKDGHHETYSGPSVIGIGVTKGKSFEGGPARTAPPTQASTALRPEQLDADLGTPTFPLKVTRLDSGQVQISWESAQAGPFFLSVTRPVSGSSDETAVWGSEVAAPPVVYAGPKLDTGTTYIFRLKAGNQLLTARKFALLPDRELENLGAAQAEVDKTDTAASHALMSEVYEQNGMIEQATMESQKAVDAQPDDAGFMQRLSGMFKQMGKQAEADKYEGMARYVEDNIEYADPDGGYWGNYMFNPYVW